MATLSDSLELGRDESAERTEVRMTFDLAGARDRT